MTSLPHYTGAKLTDWTVDYGDGPTGVQIPHCWLGEMPVDWEGPALYECRLDVPTGTPWVVFHGVSYLAEVLIDGLEVARHEGIWDAFAVDLTLWAGKKIDLAVRVTKNGGPTYPVNQVASGFIPYVHHTFGGIFRDVELLPSAPDLEPAALPSPVTAMDGRLFVGGQPWFGRGILSWGWYPEIGHPNPSDETILREVVRLKELGYNLVKFCLWLPSHEHLQILAEHDILAWLELPIWLPSPEPCALEAMRQEALRIVRQYRRHPNILAWTVGCELGKGIAPEWRRELVEEVERLTGHPLIKDNSGGAEMYGGDPREFGSFYDFHPYCEPMFYPLVFASLATGPRPELPKMLGEFNDYDVFRPVHKWVNDPPFWASDDPALNAQGVRWQFDLPSILESCQSTDLGEWLANRSDQLEASSKSQGAWMRRQAFEAAKLWFEPDAWVLTGLRHTPISSSGILDDDGNAVFPDSEVQSWNAPVSLMLLHRRSPPWVTGGNRPGWEPTTVRFAGINQFLISAWSDHDVEETLTWALFLLTANREGVPSEAGGGRVNSAATSASDLSAKRGLGVQGTGASLRAPDLLVGGWQDASPNNAMDGKDLLAAQRGYEGAVWSPDSNQIQGRVSAGKKTQIAEITLDLEPGRYLLNVTFAEFEANFELDIIESLPESPKINPEAKITLITKEKTRAIDAKTIDCPFFREACYAWEHPSWDERSIKSNWSLLQHVAGDCAIDPRWLDENHPGWQPLLIRLDTRTFQRLPVVAKTNSGIISALRLHGGLGIQPSGIERNPAGVAILRLFQEFLEANDDVLP